MFFKKNKFFYFIVFMAVVSLLTAEVNFIPNHDTFTYNEVIEIADASKSQLYTSFIVDVIPSIKSAGNLMWRPGDSDGIKQQDDTNKSYIVSRQSFDTKFAGKTSCVLYTLKAKFKDGIVNIYFEDLTVSYQKTPMSYTMSTTELIEYVKLHNDKKQKKILDEVNKELNKILKKIKGKLS